MSLQNTILFIGQYPTAGGTGGYIYTVNPDGTGVTQLSAAGNGWIYAVASPDGTKLIGMKEVGGGAVFTLFLMAEDGSGATAITNLHANAATRVAPTFSPDGSQIVLPYSSTPIGYTPAGACIANVDNSGYSSFALATLSAGNTNPVIYWSPDGQRMAFPDSNGTSGYGVSTCRAADGGDVVSVANGPSYWYDVFGWYSDSVDLFLLGMGTGSPFPVQLLKTTTVLYTDAMETHIQGSSMALSSDGSQVAFFDVDGSLNILDLASGTRTPLITPPPYPVGGIDEGSIPFFLQWVDPPTAVSSIVAGQHTTGLVRLG